VVLREDAEELDRESEIEPLERVLGAARHLLALINDTALVAPLVETLAQHVMAAPF
jgi:hypothetical protein